jgi:hypothetical protein
MQRKHGINFNEFNTRKITFPDAMGTLAKNPNSLWPEFDSNGPIQPILQFQNLLRQIEGLSRLELLKLLQAIINRLSR